MEIDAERRAELLRWADVLDRSQTAELRAAGRAIRVLCAENEELTRRLAARDGGGGGGGEDAPPAGGSPASSPATRRSRPARKRRGGGPGLPFRRLASYSGVAIAVGAVAFLFARAVTPGLAVTGPPENAPIGAAALASLSFETSVESTTWRLDGREVEPKRVGDKLVLRPRDLEDGLHTVVVRRDGRLFTNAVRSFAFVVDTKAPGLELDQPAVVNAGQPLRLAGALEPGTTLGVAQGPAVPLDEGGRFSLTVADPPVRLTLLATDAAGNTSRWLVPVTIAPRRPKEPIRAVHVTAYAWADATLRQGVLDLIAEGRINAVELDLKDEAGEIGWNAPVPLARQIGASLEIFDLKEAVELLHARGVRVIGRLVCFRDPIHAKAAWDAGRRDEVVQTPAGDPYAGYGGFTNFANPEVRKYNIDVALAAAELGVDEILYDYVRRPDGPTSEMVFPGMNTTAEQAIVDFLAESRRALAKSEVLVGASVFGVAATRPAEVAQDIPGIGRQVDYVAPMVYPSHWGPGEYEVANPNASPYDIVRRSIADFQEKVRGTGARVVPWLQDFSLGHTYGAAEVAAQIRASKDAGADEFLLWDPAVTYTADALASTAKVPALGLGKPVAIDAPGPVRLNSPGPARAAAKARTAAGKGPLSGLPPNELGVVPVVMHHQIRPDRVGGFDQTPEEFRAELLELWKRGFAPVSVGDLLDGLPDLPKGKSPVVMTFDDSTTSQLTLDDSGRPTAESAVGIMLDFARTHPGFVPRGTFYVLREPFGGVDDGGRTLRWLVDNGFELGNHTHDHLALRTLDDTEVQRQLVEGATVIEEAVPGYRIRSLSLPLGSLPVNERLAVQGSFGSQSYGPYAVLLVGANPAPSPFSSSFDAAAIPRIRSSFLPFTRPDEYGFSYWLQKLDSDPGSRYVSDGNPRKVTAPESRRSEVASGYAARFEGRA